MVQGRIQDFKLGGVDLKKLCRAEGGRKIFGVFRVKNHDFMPKNHIFSNFRGARAGYAPPLDPPLWQLQNKFFPYIPFVCLLLFPEGSIMSSISYVIQVLNRVYKSEAGNVTSQGQELRVMVFNTTFNIIQLYRGSQFYWLRKLEYPVKTTDLSQVT